MQRNQDVFCNRCGKKIEMIGGQARRDFLHVEKVWGYFSEKDGEKQSFDLCESCCDELLREFMIPAETQEQTELL